MKIEASVHSKIAIVWGQHHDCCYINCHEPGTIHIGENGADSHWICFRHLERWSQNRARFLADGGGCEMQDLGELLEGDTPTNDRPLPL